MFIARFVSNILQTFLYFGGFHGPDAKGQKMEFFFGSDTPRPTTKVWPHCRSCGDFTWPPLQSQVDQSFFVN